MLFPERIKIEHHHRAQDEAEASLRAAALSLASQLHELDEADAKNDSGKADRIAQEIRREHKPYLLLLAHQFAAALTATIYAGAIPQPPAPETAAKKK